MSNDARLRGEPGDDPAPDVSASLVHHFELTTRQVYVWTLITSCVSFGGLYGLWVTLYGWGLQLQWQTSNIGLRVAAGLGLAFLVIFGHELIHFVSFRLAGVAKRDIALCWSPKSCLAYVTLRVPLAIERFRWGVVMPALITGVLPACIGLALHRAPMVVCGAALLSAAGGDVAVLWALRGTARGARVFGVARFT